MEILIGVLCLSIIANAVQTFFLLKKRSSPSNYDARMLLHDLTSGKALVEVKRVAPDDVFIRRFN